MAQQSSGMGKASMLSSKGRPMSVVSLAGGSAPAADRVSGALPAADASMKSNHLLKNSCFDRAGVDFDRTAAKALSGFVPGGPLPQKLAERVIEKRTRQLRQSVQDGLADKAGQELDQAAAQQPGMGPND